MKLKELVPYIVSPLISVIAINVSTLLYVIVEGGGGIALLVDYFFIGWVVLVLFYLYLLVIGSVVVFFIEKHFGYSLVSFLVSSLISFGILISFLLVGNERTDYISFSEYSYANIAISLVFGMLSHSATFWLLWGKWGKWGQCGWARSCIPGSPQGVRGQSKNSV